MGKYKCIIWDWNGTLFDDLDVCLQVMNQVLEKRELPCLTVERYRDIFGFPVKEYYKRLGFDFNREPFEDISFEYMGMYRAESLSAQLNRHCVAVLESARQEGLRQVILSASQLEHLEEQVRHFGIADYFDRLLGLDHCHATSKVDIGKRWLAESGLEQSQVLMVGDTLHDYETACEIGCDCVLLSRGHQSRERVLHPGVPVIESLLEVKKFWMIES